MAHAFSGLKVIDFSQVLAGPGATQLLAMLGADVIKLENPKSGDQMRHILGLQNSDNATEDFSPGFMALNYGKRSLAIDLKNPRAKEVVNRLLEQADVVVENFRAGVIENLGFGYEAVKAIRPDIVYCSISGYGQAGPMRGAAAYDGAIQAASGMMSVTGDKTTGPTRTGYTGVDMSTAMTAAFAISSALYRRKATGEGQRLDVAMMDAAMWLMNPLYAIYLIGQEAIGLEGNRSPSGLPTANVFPTADGYVQITALTGAHIFALLESVGLDDLFDSAETVDSAELIARHDEIYWRMSELMRGQPTAHWLDVLRGAGVPCAPIRDIPGVLDDPQLEHRGIVRSVPAPTVPAVADDRDVRLVGAPFIAASDGPEVFGPPPGIGEHSDAILTDFGFAPAEIERLREDGLFGA